MKHCTAFQCGVWDRNIRKRKHVWESAACSLNDMASHSVSLPLLSFCFLHLEFTVIAFYKLGTFIIRHNWLEDKVLCNRTRYFRNVNRRKRKTQWVSRCLASFFSSFVNNSVGSTQNTKLTTWRIKITSFIVLPHKQQHIVLFHGKIYF